jgi:hypothetical protein
MTNHGTTIAQISISGPKIPAVKIWNFLIMRKTRIDMKEQLNEA